LRIVSYESIVDSGGPGLHRGGNGVCTGYMFLAPGEISIHDDRWLTYPWGVNGGLPGGRSTKLMVRTDSSREWMPSKCDRIKVNIGDILYSNTWGGGGWGDPLDRPPEKVAADCERGLVSLQGARSYGVVVNADFSIDGQATQALRTEMTSKRPPLTLFNRGGTIEEIKARCLEETSLEPPKTPIFAKRVTSIGEAHAK
jgi:N-methylhydantoinase B